MKPDPRFQAHPPAFWAAVRTIGQQAGYTNRKTRGQPSSIKTPSVEEIAGAYMELGLDTLAIELAGSPTLLCQQLIEYFDYRANLLNTQVEPNLMDVDRARETFEVLRAKFPPKNPIPMNKQKGEKKAPAYFTGIINILVEANIDGQSFDYDPRELTTITRDGSPLRTLARRVDGAYPSAVNPVAIWEIKEYYYTTTFGSRVADGVYETLLDGMELEELREHEDVNVLHYLMVDSHYTWWECGKSYLCRIIDMLNMGYVSEALFGYEVVEELPRLVKSWLDSPGPAVTGGPGVASGDLAKI